MVHSTEKVQSSWTTNILKTLIGNFDFGIGLSVNYPKLFGSCDIFINLFPNL